MVHSLVASLEKLRKFSSFLVSKFLSFTKLGYRSMKHSFHFIYQNNPLFIQLNYFAFISFAGYEALKVLKPREKPNAVRDLDLLFTSVSASTVSSMATVEMEDFSSTQLYMLTVLMLVGGEVFTSILDLVKVKLDTKGSISKRGSSVHVDIESISYTNYGPNISHDSKVPMPMSELHLEEKKQSELKAIESLGYALLVYLLVTSLGSSLSIYLYLTLVPDAQGVLKRKGIGFIVFSVFTAISSVVNCGFTPVNENMIVFRKNTIMLLLIIPQILAGNTLFAPCLRFMLWSFKKITGKEVHNFILQHSDTIGYKHLMSSRESSYLMITMISFITMQTILFCTLEWNSEALREMDSYQKIVGALFQSVNNRHAGESIIDLSSICLAILVLYTVMMYLPGYTSFLPKYDRRHSNTKKKERRETQLENWIFSQLSYLAIFVMLVCITERDAMTTDPLNFNVFSILFEVVSAYGNVGFSIGYSCKRQLIHDVHCKDASYGFVGKWSDKGKLILIIVMIFGRLKTFNMKGGRAWKVR